MADLDALRALGLETLPQTQVALFAEAETDRLLSLITAKTKIGSRFAETFSLTISTTNARRHTSWGGLRRGAPFISLSLETVSAARPGHVYTFHEYPSIADRPFIGTLRACTWQQYVRCLIAHETAHAYCHAWHRFNSSRQSIEDGHGPKWQAIYRAFRTWIMED